MENGIRLDRLTFDSIQVLATVYTLKFEWSEQVCRCRGMARRTRYFLPPIQSRT